MADSRSVPVAIVDYGLGNLYSVRQACEWVGLSGNITFSKKEIAAADAVILPGVGAFGDAMEVLRKLDLCTTLRNFAASCKPLIGICLGVQLLMTESFEFGHHKGLGIIEGAVVRFPDPVEGDKRLKVPHIGWNRIYRNTPHGTVQWSDTLLDGVAEGEYMYFVHSYIVQPQNSGVVMSTSTYGNIDFCSSLKCGNVFGFQFHPERSGAEGLKIYRNLAQLVKTAMGETV